MKMGAWFSSIMNITCKSFRCNSILVCIIDQLAFKVIHATAFKTAHSFSFSFFLSVYGYVLLEVLSSYVSFNNINIRSVLDFPVFKYLSYVFRSNFPLGVKVIFLDIAKDVVYLATKVFVNGIGSLLRFSNCCNCNIRSCICHISACKHTLHACHKCIFISYDCSLPGGLQ